MARGKGTGLRRGGGCCCCCRWFVSPVAFPRQVSAAARNNNWLCDGHLLRLSQVVGNGEASLPLAKAAVAAASPASRKLAKQAAGAPVARLSSAVSHGR